MAWSEHPTDRKATLPPDWERRRRAVFQRDGWRCTYVDPDTGRCRGPAEECDHVRSRDNHDPTNLTSLCSYHHGKKSGGQGGAARAKKVRQSRQRFRRDEGHPGSL